jgi:hypothetical protein
MTTKSRNPSKGWKPGQFDALREIGRFGDSPTFGELIESYALVTIFLK